MAQAQTAPVAYWIAGRPFGFGGQMTGQGTGQAFNSYGNFPGFDGGDARGGGYSRYQFSNGWFIGGEGGGMGFSGLSQAVAFGTTGSLRYEGMQFGYDFQHGGGLPVTLFAGVDTLKYDAGGGGPFAAFDSNSGALPGYRAHAGVEIQPAPNLSLSLGFGYTQQPQGITGDANLLALPGASAFAFSGRR